MKTTKKIKEGEYEITETREDKRIITFTMIDRSITMLDESIDRLSTEVELLKKQKKEQEDIKKELQKIN